MKDQFRYGGQGSTAARCFPKKPSVPFKISESPGLVWEGQAGSGIMLSDAVFGDGHNKVTDKVP